MKISIICIGKIKEAYLKEGIAEYSKRLSKYCVLELEERKEERSSDNPNEAEIRRIIQAEGEQILKKVSKEAYIIALDVKGRQMPSEGLAEMINQLGVDGKSNLVFLIGGSYGLSEDVLQRADFKLSFSPMTFPHQLMRLILLEQIYRGFKIIKNEVYHK